MNDACDICGAPDPDYLRWVDLTIADYFQRVTQAIPGKTSLAVRYCANPACQAAVEAKHGPQGNRAAFNRLTDELGKRGLDANDNEIRMTALCAQLLEARGH
jgi:hypothetical protein